MRKHHEWKRTSFSAAGNANLITERNHVEKLAAEHDLQSIKEVIYTYQEHLTTSYSYKRMTSRMYGYRKRPAQK